MTHAPPRLDRRTTVKALVGGVLAYTAIKLVAVGMVTGIGLTDVLASPDLLLPPTLSRALSEMCGVGLILLLAISFLRVSPRSGFLAVALVQAAVGWWAPAEWKDGWMRWLFGASGLDDLWAQAGLSPPFQPHSMFGALSVTDLIACAAAGAVAQVVHNLAAGQAEREARTA